MTRRTHRNDSCRNVDPFGAAGVHGSMRPLEEPLPADFERYLRSEGLAYDAMQAERAIADKRIEQPTGGAARVRFTLRGFLALFGRCIASLLGTRSRRRG